MLHTMHEETRQQMLQDLDSALVSMEYALVSTSRDDADDRDHLLNVLTSGVRKLYLARKYLETTVVGSDTVSFAPSVQDGVSVSFVAAGTDG